MNFYHYYDKKKGPFKNLSDCSVDEANRILGKIRPVKARFAQGLDSAVFRVCIKP